MATQKQLIDEFKSEIMRKFIELCRGNDYNKLSLLRIGETINRIYEKYITLPMVDAEEVVRCRHCKKEWCYLRQELGEDGFCSAGERKNEKW